MLGKPVYCNPDAYDLFAKEVPKLDTTDGFLRASIAVAMHALDDVVPDDTDDYLLALATRVRARTRSDQVSALVANLHEVLFVEEGFAGDNNIFYHPLSSYVPAVCLTRRGNPVTLAAIYKVVAVRTGLFVQGLNSPGRFLVRVRGAQSWLTVDPFDRGRVLSPVEAIALVEEVTDRLDASRDDVFRPATHALWLSRIIANLESILSSTGCYDDLAAMQNFTRYCATRFESCRFKFD